MLWDAGMKNDFLTLKNANPGYQVWVTGHSLGGAMAAVAASEIVHYGYTSASNLKLYTFGQPRTGDTIFAQKHDSIVSCRNNFRDVIFPFSFPIPIVLLTKEIWFLMFLQRIFLATIIIKTKFGTTTT